MMRTTLGRYTHPLRPLLELPRVSSEAFERPQDNAQGSANSWVRGPPGYGTPHPLDALVLGNHVVQSSRVAPGR